ncbi:MAG: hypothetical protein WD425_19240 [Nitrospirales bacterium]
MSSLISKSGPSPFLHSDHQWPGIYGRNLWLYYLAIFPKAEITPPFILNTLLDPSIFLLVPDALTVRWFLTPDAPGTLTARSSDRDFSNTSFTTPQRYTSGINAISAADEFLQHAYEEQMHADQLA